MKAKNEPPATPSNEAPATPSVLNDDPPAFDQANAIWQEPPYRHEPSARTVVWHQPLTGGRTALFTATGQLIAIDVGSNPPAPLNS